MATQGKKSTYTQNRTSRSFDKLPFHTPTISKADKATIAEQIAKGSIDLTHINLVLRETDWLKIRFDSENGVWLVIHSFTSMGADQPIGLVTHRAKRLENALGMAVWASDQLSDSDFIQDDDDDF